MFASTFLALWALILTINHAEASGEWAYGVNNGPQTKNWAALCRDGKRQSPININVDDTVEDPDLASLTFDGYDQIGKVTISNGHHSVSATGFENWVDPPYIMNGGLVGKYNLIAFHLHWGQDDTLGSEHQVNFVPFPLEVHFVHLKEGLTLEAALNSGDGLAVVGVLFKRDNNNPAPLLQLDTAYNKTIPFDATRTPDIFLSDMLPADRTSFYRYEGSLTTPGCNEAVIWTVMKDKLTVTENQMKVLRKHESEPGHEVTNNFRNLQKLNGRTVWRSYA